MTKKIFYPVLVLALTLFGLQSCEPKTSVKKTSCRGHGAYCQGL